MPDVQDLSYSQLYSKYCRDTKHKSSLRKLDVDDVHRRCLCYSSWLRSLESLFLNYRINSTQRKMKSCTIKRDHVANDSTIYREKKYCADRKMYRRRHVPRGYLYQSRNEKKGEGKPNSSQSLRRRSPSQTRRNERS